MSDTNLEQKGGMGSTNVQILEQNNRYGLSYNDVTSLCKDLIQFELSSYKNEALKIASEREEKLRNSILLHNYLHLYILNNHDKYGDFLGYIDIQL